MQYVNGEPSLCFGANRFGQKRSWVMGLSRAHEYVESNGDPTQYAMVAALRMADVLGFNTDTASLKRSAHQFLDVILLRVPDLLAMAPDPDHGLDIDALAEKAHREGLVIRQGGDVLVDFSK